MAAINPFSVSAYSREYRAVDPKVEGSSPFGGVLGLASVEIVIFGFPGFGRSFLFANSHVVYLIFPHTFAAVATWFVFGNSMYRLSPEALAISS